MIIIIKKKTKQNWICIAKMSLNDSFSCILHCHCGKMKTMMRTMMPNSQGQPCNLSTAGKGRQRWWPAERTGRESWPRTAGLTMASFPLLSLPGSSRDLNLTSGVQGSKVRRQHLGWMLQWCTLCCPKISVLRQHEPDIPCWEGVNSVDTECLVLYIPEIM